MRVTGDAARGFRGPGGGVFGSTIAFMRGVREIQTAQSDARCCTGGGINASMRLIETGRWRVGRHNAQRGWRPLCALPGHQAALYTTQNTDVTSWARAGQGRRDAQPDHQKTPEEWHPP